VDVRFTYDVNGLLQVEATVVKSQVTHTLVIEGNPGMLTDAEIKDSLKALSTLKIHPRDMIENRTALARAERLYEQFRGDMREWLGKQIGHFEEALATQDVRVVTPQRKRFEEMLDQLERDSFLDGGGNNDDQR
jgi:molecular chaperone HscC